MRPFDVPLDDERTQFDAFVEEYRSAIETTLDGLTEEQARRRLVPSATTLLGLLKHVTWMQRVWFEECVGGISRRELGLVQSPDEAFRLSDSDSIASVTAAHRQACATARTTIADLPLDAVMTATGPDRARFAGCTCKFCGSWPTTADTPTSSANRYLPTEFRDPQPVRECDGVVCGYRCSGARPRAADRSRAVTPSADVDSVG